MGRELFWMKRLQKAQICAYTHKNFLTYFIWVSKDAEFYAEFKSGKKLYKAVTKKNQTLF